MKYLWAYSVPIIGMLGIHYQGFWCWSAMIYAFIMIDPMNKITPMFFPIGMPAYVFGFIFLGVEYYLSRRGNTGIAHDAHFWGAIYGIVLTLILKPSLASSFIHQITGS